MHAPSHVIVGKVFYDEGTLHLVLSFIINHHTCDKVVKMDSQLSGDHMLSFQDVFRERRNAGFIALNFLDLELSPISWSLVNYPVMGLEMKDESGEVKAEIEDFKLHLWRLFEAVCGG